MNGFVVTMWLLGAGMLGASPSGVVLMAHARCQLRSVPVLLATGEVRPGCPCGKGCAEDVEDKDVVDKDVEDKDVEDQDACDGCDTDTDDQEQDGQ